jgi:hypothetical protein
MLAEMEPDIRAADRDLREIELLERKDVTAAGKLSDYEALQPRLDALMKAHEEDLHKAGELEKRIASLMNRYATNVRLRPYALSHGLDGLLRSTHCLSCLSLGMIFFVMPRLRLRGMRRNIRSKRGLVLYDTPQCITRTCKSRDTTINTLLKLEAWIFVCTSCLRLYITLEYDSSHSLCFLSTNMNPIIHLLDYQISLYTTLRHFFS